MFLSDFDQPTSEEKPVITLDVTDTIGRQMYIINTLQGAIFQTHFSGSHPLEIDGIRASTIDNPEKLEHLDKLLGIIQKAATALESMQKTEGLIKSLAAQEKIDQEYQEREEVKKTLIDRLKELAKQPSTIISEEDLHDPEELKALAVQQAIADGKLTFFFCGNLKPVMTYRGFCPEMMETNALYVLNEAATCFQLVKFLRVNESQKLYVNLATAQTAEATIDRDFYCFDVDTLHDRQYGKPDLSHNSKKDIIQSVIRACDRFDTLPISKVPYLGIPADRALATYRKMLGIEPLSNLQTVSYIQAESEHNKPEYHRIEFIEGDRVRDVVNGMTLTINESYSIFIFNYHQLYSELMG